PTLQYKDGTTKGNCDTELVLQVMHELHNFKVAYIISGDGDFYSLYQYLLERNKLGKIIIPNRKQFSALLRHFMSSIYFLDHPDIIHKIKRGI
ncbi:NYN domain-containing protein, partial [Candidatus Gracilibacteria bacterium]|nr:NYN domain-containing protein [Candidatus Gracilibacteria bacterium]